MSSIAPTPALSDMASGYKKTQALYVAAKLGLADHLAEGPQNSQMLAQAVGAHPGALYKLLRFLECSSTCQSRLREHSDVWQPLT